MRRFVSAIVIGELFPLMTWHFQKVFALRCALRFAWPLGREPLGGPRPARGGPQAEKACLAGGNWLGNCHMPGGIDVAKSSSWPNRPLADQTINQSRVTCIIHASLLLYTVRQSLSHATTMPPKKAAGGKKKKGASSSFSDNGLDLSQEDQIKYLQCQITALQSEISARSETAANLATQKDEMKREMVETVHRQKQEKEVSEAVVRDATRQYKAMKEQLLGKINTRDNAIQNLRDEMERKQKCHDDMVKEKDDIILQRDKDIQAIRGEVEDLCSRFAGMLGTALDNVTDFLNRKATEHNTSEDIEQQLRAMYGGGACNSTDCNSVEKK